MEEKASYRSTDHTCMACGEKISRDFHEVSSSTGLNMCEYCMRQVFSWY